MQTRSHSLYDVDAMGDGDRHQDEERGTALAVETHAAPAGEAQRGQEDGNQHQNDRNHSPQRAQQNDGDKQHRPERDGSEQAHVLVQRVLNGTIEGEFASDVVLEGRILRPSLGSSAVEVVGNLYFTQLPILGKRNTDNQPGNATVPGNQAPGYLLGIERDSLDSFYVSVAQGTGVVDQRLDNELVLEAFAMRIVCNRVDAGDIGRSPQQIGQLFYGNERFLRENGAVLRRHGNQRGIGDRVGVFQLFERDKAGVVLAEMIPKIDVDLYYVHGARSEGQYDNQREQEGQPSATHNQRYAGFQIHINMPFCG